MTRSVFACAILTLVASAGMPFVWADDFAAPASAVVKATTPESAFAPLTYASAELTPAAANDQPAPPPDTWTAPPLVGQSPYLSNGNRFWGGADLLVWGIKPGNTPPLATSGTLASLGAIGPGSFALTDRRSLRVQRVLRSLRTVDCWHCQPISAATVATSSLWCPRSA